MYLSKGFRTTKSVFKRRGRGKERSSRFGGHRALPRSGKGVALGPVSRETGSRSSRPGKRGGRSNWVRRDLTALPALSETLPLTPPPLSAKRGRSRLQAWKPAVGGRSVPQARQQQETGARSSPGATAAARPRGDLPNVSPGDRWCCRQRGRRPAAHPGDDRLLPGPALPFSELSGGSAS